MGCGCYVLRESVLFSAEKPFLWMHCFGVSLSQKAQVRYYEFCAKAEV